MREEKPHTITVTGDLGSGKSTICRMIAGVTNYKYYSTGQIQRRIAERYGMTTLELNQYSMSHAEIDKEIDGLLIEIAAEEKEVILDSRLAWFFSPKSFKVYLAVDDDVAAGRIMATDRGTTEAYRDSREARDKIRERKRLEDIRYKDEYGADCSDLRNFDLVIDTSLCEPEYIAALLVEKYQQWREAGRFPRYWSSPRSLYPTIRARNLKADLIKSLRDSISSHGYDEKYPVSVITDKGFSYIRDGHHRAAASILSDIRLIPIDEEAPAADAATGRRRRNGDVMNMIYDWESMFGFRFMKYPAL